MAYRLIGQDIAIQVTDGGAAIPPTFGTATNVKALAKSVSISEKLETGDTTSLGDTRKQLRAKFAGSTIKVEMLVPSTGPQFEGDIGHFFKVENKALSTLSTFTSYVGLLTDWSLEESDGQMIETLTIECDADGDT